MSATIIKVGANKRASTEYRPEQLEGAGAKLKRHVKVRCELESTSQYIESGKGIFVLPLKRSLTWN